MLGIATDGYYCPATVVVITRSLGGALGGVPNAPELRPARPEILADTLEPGVVADDIAPSAPVTQPLADFKPQLASRRLRPTLTTDDDEPC